MGPTQLNRIFVYGTLCRGQCREQCWPYAPRSVEAAFVAGRLYDFGPYPGVIPGEHWVRGELWSFASEQIAETLRILDEIEDYRGRSDDLYRRVIMDCHCRSPQQAAKPAYMYVFAQDLTAATEIQPGSDGACSWPPATPMGALGRVPKR